MNTTTNYGLKQYGGTDLFNPLTVENVNMGDIDTALKAVSDHAVGAATELTTGTVHAITRSDTDRNVFAFVATSNYESGDTFTLDGTQVSALTPDGQPLATGSYVIGSTVLCALHDTLITVYVNPAKAKDSDKLDGHDSSYFATDSDLDTVAGTIGAISDKVGSAVLTTTAPDLSGAVNELNTHLNDNDVLWEGGASSGTITLAHSYKLYAKLDIVMYHQEPGMSPDWSVNKTINLKHMNGVLESGYSVLMVLFDQVYVSLRRVDDTHFTVTSTAATINGIYGIKVQ